MLKFVDARVEGVIVRRIERYGVIVVAATVLAIGVQATAQQLRLPQDAVYAKAPGSPGKVVFSHTSHVAYSEKCTACHVKLFPILRPTRQVTHAFMEAGESCGACHNGQMAFGPGDPATCTRCHAG